MKEKKIQKYEGTVGKEWHNTIYTQPRMRKNLVFVKDGTVQLKPRCGRNLLSGVMPNILTYYQKYWASIITPNTVPLKWRLEASKKKNESTVYFNLYGDTEQLSSKPRFKVGDKVRISRYKRKIFDKRYTLHKIQSTNPITYRLKDLNNEEIQGSFYEPELLKVKQDVFCIEKVIRRDYKKKQALVKWMGYSDDFNSWIPLSSLQDLSN